MLLGGDRERQGAGTTMEWRAPGELARQDTAATGWPSGQGPQRRPPVQEGAGVARALWPHEDRGGTVTARIPRETNALAGAGQRSGPSAAARPNRHRVSPGGRPRVYREPTVPPHGRRPPKVGVAGGGGRSAARPCWPAPRMASDPRGLPSEPQEAAPTAFGTAPNRVTYGLRPAAPGKAPRPHRPGDCDGAPGRRRMWKPRRAKPGGATRFATLSREAAPRDCGGSPAWARAPPDRDTPELRRGTLAGTTVGVGTAPDGARQDTGAIIVARRV